MQNSDLCEHCYLQQFKRRLQEEFHVDLYQNHPNYSLTDSIDWLGPITHLYNTAIYCLNLVRNFKMLMGEF